MCVRLLTQQLALQIQPGVKDIRTALANAIAENQDPYGDRSPSESGEQGGGMSERQVCPNFSELSPRQIKYLDLLSAVLLICLKEFEK
jgi:hypothetical protein